MATAPEGAAIGTAYCGRHGGNMDNNRIAVGTRVHLPVRVPGASFYVGDVHASMGDGEVCGTGVEIGARVHLRVRAGREGQGARMAVDGDAVVADPGGLGEDLRGGLGARGARHDGPARGAPRPVADRRLMLVSAIGGTFLVNRPPALADRRLGRVEVPKLNAGLTVARSGADGAA